MVFLYIFCLSLFFFFCCFIVLFVPSFKLGVFLLDWGFLSLKFNLNFNNLLFSLILLIVSTTVLYYSLFYMTGEVNFYYYLMVLLIFIGSMFGLIFANSMFTMMLCWDLLGISSFFLVLFYNNWDSCSGAMHTVLTNRIGDFFIFMFFTMAFFSFYYFFSFSLTNFYFILFLLLASFTKSAQFPFSGWLPKAMSAPTPVSSLVHSSTLVTAGLVLMMNFNLINLSSYVMFILCWVGVFTMFFSSLTALVEMDLKKVVALSTLSQMGFSMLSLGLGLNYVALIHLISHALFKSCLFMQVGYIIHCSFGQQDMRNYNGMGSLPYFIQLQLLTTLFCLCGLFFTSGSVSKDIILEMFFSNDYSLFFVLFFFISVFFTFCYSYRIWSSLFNTSTVSLFHYSGSFIINFVSFVLVLMSVCFIWWLNINMYCIPSLFLYMDFYVPLFYLFFILVIFYFSFKFVSFELVYKFLVDYFPFLAQRVFFFNFKVVEMFLNSLNLKLFSFFSVVGFYSGSYMKSYFSPVVFLVFLVFFLV
uniref:NADH:ubiquinone reductase (H(+)-translocating) n=1 Tax=Strongyloides venezuelensis TaxID=75913 RepID=A0A0P0YKD8_STRVS|nr:NADH dehydrogenase subunit 5 [Strongyloides venezuelensis]BAT21215.1 NADH dehydrogenase subunit 5 [Strongyloides venezuelensis]